MSDLRITLTLDKYLAQESKSLRKKVMRFKQDPSGLYTLMLADLVESYCNVLEIMAQQERAKGKNRVEKRV